MDLREFKRNPENISRWNANKRKIDPSDSYRSVHHIIFKEQIEYLLGLDDKSLECLDKYVTSYRSFNQPLRKLGEFDPEFLDCVYRLDEVFKNLPPFKENFKVFRFSSARTLKDLRVVGDIFTDNGYFSTSLDIAVPRMHGEDSSCCFFSIFVPSGAKVLPLFIFSMEWESEILFNRGSQFEFYGEVAGDKHSEDMHHYALKYILPPITASSVVVQNKKRRIDSGSKRKNKKRNKTCRRKRKSKSKTKSRKR